MALETRGHRQFYYTARKIGGRVVKEYVGGGAVAEAIAERAEAERARRKEVEDIERALDQLDELCNLIFEASMYAAGYHRPKRGPWRKRRDNT